MGNRCPPSRSVDRMHGYGASERSSISKWEEQADEVADEAARLQWLAGRAPVPRVIAYERVGDERYLLTQAIEGVPSYAITQQRLEAVRALADGLRLLHALDVRRVPVRRAPRGHDGKGARQRACGPRR